MTMISVKNLKYGSVHHLGMGLVVSSITVASSISSSSSAPRHFMTRRMGQVGNTGALVERPAT
jgi:hypothetical protein